MPIVVRNRTRTVRSFPRKFTSWSRQPEHRPFPAADVLKSLNLEALVVSAAARTILDGKTLNDDDQERLMTAFRRIERAVELSGVNRRG